MLRDDEVVVVALAVAAPRGFMRRFTRTSFRSLILSLAGGASIGLSCGPEATETEPRPSDDEIAEFYTEFCVYWAQCDASAWQSVGECADVQVAGYENLPTACLNRLIEYQRCVIEQECEKFNTPTPAEECRPLKQAIDQVDCGGMPAP